MPRNMVGAVNTCEEPYKNYLQLRNVTAQNTVVSHVFHVESYPSSSLSHGHF